MLSPAVTPPTCPTPAGTIAEAINRIGPLNGLPFEDRLWLARNGSELVGQVAGELAESTKLLCLLLDAGDFADAIEERRDHALPHGRDGENHLVEL